MDSGSLDNLVGKPYAKGGIGPDKFDCYGLAKYISDMYDLGYPEANFIYDYRARDKQVNANRCLFNKITSPQFGDIVTIRLGRYVSHVGVMLDSFRFIHADEPFGVVITRIDSTKYRSKIEGIYRCKKS